MHRPALLSLVLAAGAATAAEVPIDLNTWSQRGPAGNGVWTVAPDGSSVLQSVNGNPTFFVSPLTQIDTTLRGQIRVETTGDDDLIGFVLGYQAPAGSGSDMDFVLFDWKQADQSSGGATSFEGFALSRVQGTVTDYIPGFWGRADSAGFDNLATNYGSTLGWEDNTTYDFTIVYQAGRVTVAIAGGAFGSGATVLDVSGSFPAGAFGFYNYSQASVRYSGLTSELTPPVPEPTTWALWAAGLAVLGLRGARRPTRRSAPAARAAARARA